MSTPTPPTDRHFTLIKRDIVRHLTRQFHLTRAEAEAMFLSILELMSGHLVSGGRIELRGFGVFEVKDCRGCIGRNPRKPRESFRVPDHKTVRFKVGKYLRARLNQK